MEGSQWRREWIQLCEHGWEALMAQAELSDLRESGVGGEGGGWASNEFTL